MSHFSSVKVQYKDVPTLIDALVKCGFRRDQIEVHAVPQLIKDYHGRTTKYSYKDTQDERFKDGDKAHVIVRRQHMGPSHNDMGFYVDSKGGSVEFLCDFARGSNNASANKIAHADGGYAPWLKRVKREYSAATAMRSFKSQGKVAKRVDGKDGKIRIYARA